MIILLHDSVLKTITYEQNATQRYVLPCTQDYVTRKSSKCIKNYSKLNFNDSTVLQFHIRNGTGGELGASSLTWRTIKPNKGENKIFLKYILEICNKILETWKTEDGTWKENKIESIYKGFGKTTDRNR